MIYTKGNESLLTTKCEAIVGTRRASPYGKWAAYELGKRLAKQGTTLITSLTSGINEKAISGCLGYRGKVILVMPGGTDVVYPYSMADTFKAVIDNGGLVISYHEEGYIPKPSDFAESKKLIVEYADAITVVEAMPKSSSLIVASMAIEAGKELRAVPGNINQPGSQGTNKLISEGAKVVLTIKEEEE